MPPANDHRSRGAADRLRMVLAVSSSLLVAQVVGAILSGSLALLADAGHLLADVAGVGLSLFAMRMAQRPPSTARTFGHQRAEILAAFANAVLLLGVAVAVLVEGVRRLASPPTVDGGLVVLFGAIALAGNGLSMVALKATTTVFCTGMALKVAVTVSPDGVSRSSSRSRAIRRFRPPPPGPRVRRFRAQVCR